MGTCYTIKEKFQKCGEWEDDGGESSRSEKKMES